MIATISRRGRKRRLPTPKARPSKPAANAVTVTVSVTPESIAALAAVLIRHHDAAAVGDHAEATR